MARLNSPLPSTIFTLFFLAGVFSLSLGYLQFRTQQSWQKAHALQAQGRLEEASTAFREMIDELGPWRWATGWFDNSYWAARVSRLETLYQLADFDTLLGEAQSVLPEEDADRAAVHFWRSLAMIRMAEAQEEEAEARAWLRRALAETRSALEAQSGSWILRYNFELLGTILQSRQPDTEKQPFRFIDPFEEKFLKKERKIVG